jgi:hypothetical protein
MKTVLSLALVAAFVAVPSYAACTYPKAPENPPDGSTATLEAMVTSQKAYKAFDAAIADYQRCLEGEHNEALAANPALTDEQKAERIKILNQKVNASAVEAETAAEKINAQIRVWREKNAKK